MIEIRSFQSKEIISTFEIKDPFGFTFHSNLLIVADAFSHKVRILDCETGEKVGSIQCKTDSQRFKPISVAVDADDNIVVFCYLAKGKSCLHVFTLANVFIRRVGSMSFLGGGTIAFDLDSNLVVSDNGGSRVRVFDYGNGQVIRTLSIQNRPDTANKTLFMYCGGFGRLLSYFCGEYFGL
jgi:DNA-binding beta-propeller fold protein YncE